MSDRRPVDNPQSPETETSNGNEPLPPMFAEVRPSRRFVIVMGVSAALLIVAGTPGLLFKNRSPEEEAETEALKQEYEQKHPLTEQFGPFSSTGTRVRLVDTEHARILRNNIWGEPAIARQTEDYPHQNSAVALPWQYSLQRKATQVIGSFRVDTYRSSKERNNLLVPRVSLDWRFFSPGTKQEYILTEDRPMEINFQDTRRSLFVALAAYEVIGRGGRPKDQGQITITTVGRSE